MVFNIQSHAVSGKQLVIECYAEWFIIFSPPCITTLGGTHARGQNFY